MPHHKKTTTLAIITSHNMRRRRRLDWVPFLRVHFRCLFITSPFQQLIIVFSRIYFPIFPRLSTGSGSGKVVGEYSWMETSSPARQPTSQLQITNEHKATKSPRDFFLQNLCGGKNYHHPPPGILLMPDQTWATWLVGCVPHTGLHY